MKIPKRNNQHDQSTTKLEYPENTIQIDATNEDGTKDSLTLNTETGKAIYNGEEIQFAEKGDFIPAESSDVGTFAVTGPPGGGSNSKYIGKTPYKYNIAMVGAMVAAQAIAKWTKIKYKDILPIITYLLGLDHTYSYHDVFQYRYPQKCTQYVYRNYTKFYTNSSKNKIYKQKWGSYFFGGQPSPASCTPSG